MNSEKYIKEKEALTREKILEYRKFPFFPKHAMAVDRINDKLRRLRRGRDK